MGTFLQQAAIATPLFSLVVAGYLVMRLTGWPTAMSDALSRFVFSIALPAMLFRLMSDFSRLPPVDARLLIAFFGGCLVVFGFGRLIGWKLFGLDGVAQSVFALGGVASNNVMLGLPLAKMALGDEALPAAALIIVFNALVLWTLVTVSIEWARHGSLSVRGFSRTVQNVLKNPIIAAIFCGTLFGLTGWKLAPAIDTPLHLIGQAATPMALVALGMSLAEYGVRDGWKVSAVVCAIKLLLHPLAVWSIALALGLPAIETRVAVLNASVAVGVNAYLMARHFKVLEGPVAGSLVLSTLLAALTTPLVLALLGH